MGQTTSSLKCKSNPCSPLLNPRNLLGMVKRKKKGHKRIGYDDGLDLVFDSPRLLHFNFNSHSDSNSTSIKSNSTVYESSRLSSPASPSQYPIRYRYADFGSLKNDWTNMEDKKKLFVLIFEDILLSADAEMFRKLPKKTALGADITLQNHASNVYRFFETIMNKESLDAVWEVSLALGKRHSQFGVSFNAAYWLNIKKNLIKHLSPNETLPIHILWSKFIHDVIKQARTGFNQAILDNLSVKHLPLDAEQLLL